MQFQEPKMTYTTTDECRPPADGTDQCPPPDPEPRRLHRPESSDSPPCLQWRGGLRALLDDSDGVGLFQTYLEHEKCVEYLDFWLACRGLKNPERRFDSREKARLIRIIHRKFMRGHTASLAVDAETRKAVEREVQAAATSGDVHVFDVAQSQMEEFMDRTLYPNFLQSDLYLNYVQSAKGCEETTTSGSETSSAGCGAALETVDENEVLDNCDGKRPMRFGRRSTRVAAKRGEPYVGSNGAAADDSARCYATYAPYVTVSVQDSELQSLSSDAHTDDAMSLTDSSLDNYSVNSKKYLKNARRYAHHNRETNLPHDKFVPLPQRNGVQKQNIPKSNDVAAFAAELIRRLEVVVVQQEHDVKMEKLLDNDKPCAAQPPRSCHSSSSFGGLIPELLKLSRPDGIDDQSILDEHVDRVWCDEPSEITTHLRHHRPESPHRQRCRDRDVGSDLSTDSGTVRDYLTPRCASSRPREPTNRRSSARTGDHNALNASANEKVRSWINNHPDFDLIRHRRSVPNTQNKTKKANWFDQAPLPSQPLAQDPSMPMLPPPNTTTQLEEARRRLVDDAQARQMSRSKSGFPLKEKTHSDVLKARTLPIRTNVAYDASAGGDNNNKKSSSNRKTASNSPILLTESDVTAILYCIQGQSVPYLSKLAGRNVTLAQFKTLLPKKGKYRYFFKTRNNDLEIDAVNVEIVDDNAILPLWDGKVCAQVHLME